MEREYEVTKLKRNKLFVIWGVYLLVVAGLVKMSMIFTGGSSDPAMVIAALCFFAIPVSLILLVFPITMIRNIRNDCTWSSYPPVEEYIKMHCPNIDGIKCCSCGSREIWRYSYNLGFLKKGNLHQCHQCGTWLYRTG